MFCSFAFTLRVCRASRPADFSYKHDAKHNSIFTVAQLWDDASDERILDTLKNVLSDTSKVGTFLQLPRP